MKFTTALVTAMMLFSIYFIVFATPSDADMGSQSVVAVLVALAGGALAYIVARPRRSGSSE